jgi:diamine N-acetyltransferase
VTESAPITDDVTLREAAPSDAARLSLLGQATFLESYAGMLPVGDILAHGEKQHAASAYARWLADPEWHCWVVEAVQGAAPVGYLLMGPPDLPVIDTDAHDLEIRRIYLLHRFHRKGLAREMMAAATVRARERGCRRLLLGVYSRNDAALAFYARLGFERIGERRFRVGDGEYFDYVLGRTL